jgi:hypothetical protein
MAYIQSRAQFLEHTKLHIAAAAPCAQVFAIITIHPASIYYLDTTTIFVLE